LAEVDVTAKLIIRRIAVKLATLNIDGGYHLYNPFHPGIRVVVIVI
jgi:hypothetical protein